MLGIVLIIPQMGYIPICCHLLLKVYAALAPVGGKSAGDTLDLLCIWMIAQGIL